MSEQTEGGQEKAELSQVHHLLGLVYKQLHQAPKAIQHFQMALQLNSMDWSSFQELCDLGAFSQNKISNTVQLVAGSWFKVNHVLAPPASASESASSSNKMAKASAEVLKKRTIKVI